MAAVLACGLMTWLDRPLHRPIPVRPAQVATGHSPTIVDLPAPDAKRPRPPMTITIHARPRRSHPR
jgi:hypothetical protein